MASVKVRVGDELRRFSVARTATWTDVEAKLRELLNVASLHEYTVTYVDEDGDNVAVGSDVELRELLARSTPLRLTVERHGATPAPAASGSSTPTSEDGVAIDRDGSEDDFVDLAADATTTAAPAVAPATAATTPVRPPHVDTIVVESIPDIDDVMATDPTPSSKPSASSTGGGASSAAPASSSSKPTASAPTASAPAATSSSASGAAPTAPPSSSSSSDPLGALFEQFHTLVQTAVERNGDLIERGSHLVEQIAAQAHQQAEAARRAHAERAQAEWARRRAAWEAHRAAWINAQQPPSRRVATGKVPASESDDANDGAEAYVCGANGSCGPTRASRWQARGGCGPRFDATPVFRQAFAEHLAQLHELGFDDDELNQQLLHLFNGNVAAVVNALA